MSYDFNIADDGTHGKGDKTHGRVRDESDNDSILKLLLGTSRS